MGTVASYEEQRSTRVDAVAWHSVAEGPHRVLPDGCMDVIWWRDRLLVAGPDTTAHHSEARAGESIVGLRFDPGVLPELLGVPATELTDQRVALGDVWGHARTRRLEEHLAVLDEPDALEDLVVAGLRAHGRANDRPTAPGLPADSRRHLVERIASGCSIAALAAETGWSERHLLRRSRELFGYGPSVLRRVLRLQRALGAAGTGRPLARIANDSGYSDQAHLSRDVRSLTGTTFGALVD